MQSKKPSEFEKKVKGSQKDLIRYINLQLASMGQPIYQGDSQEGKSNYLIRNLSN